jgi:hypothetical protein
MGCKKKGWEGYTTNDRPACGGYDFLDRQDQGPKSQLWGVKWRIRFRKISRADYFTPLMHIPCEETCVVAATAKDAWEAFVTAPYAGDRESYRCIDIVPED